MKRLAALLFVPGIVFAQSTDPKCNTDGCSITAAQGAKIVQERDEMIGAIRLLRERVYVLQLTCKSNVI